jgi:tRNA A-37 threonylcarbamoyl transferase component Bud32
MSQGLEGLLSGHTLVKRYKIEDVCGRGGFAVVYRATDTRLGRPVAVKVITLTAEDPEQREVLRQRLHREARAAASLPHHPNLVTVHDVGTDPELGLDFLVMELLQGENLSQALQRERPPLERGLRILRDAAEGLAIGHRAGLVHRDVKPGNIFLAAPHHDGPDAFRVCLLDYGIAQAIEDDQTVTRGMGANPLSPAFASPEQLRGDRDLSPATDVFSLGVVGYQLLTGERPFTTEPGQMPTGWTVRKPIRELNPEVPPAVDEVVMRAMSVNPRDRFVDADAFAEALDAALDAGHERNLAARVAAPPSGVLSLDEALEDDETMVAPAPAIHVVPPKAAAPADAPHRPVPPLRPPSHAAPRKRSKLPVVLVLALLLAAAAAWAAMSGGGGGESREADARPAAGTETPATGAGGAALDDAGQPVETPPVQRTGGDVDLPAGSTGEGGTSPSGGAPATTTTTTTPGGQTVTRPSAPAPQPSAPVTGQPQQPGVPQPQPSQPAAQPQQPAARPPVQQPSPPAAQPSRPPAQQPSRPPVQQPQPQPQQPQQPPAPQPQQPQPRPEPPLLGRPIDQPPPQQQPAAPAPRDTLFIPSPPR